jgi:hypothetical protein
LCIVTKEHPYKASVVVVRQRNKGVPIGPPKGAKLGYGLEEHLSLSPSDRKRRVSIAKRLKARRTSVGRKPANSVWPEDAPSPALNLLVGQALLALELFLHRFAQRFGAVSPCEPRRQRERELGRPIGGSVGHTHTIRNRNGDA